MSRLVLAFAVTAALALPMAAPAVAAPENYVDGQLVSEETYAPPSGLVGKVQSCRSERSFESNGLSVWDPVYILWPAR